MPHDLSFSVFQMPELRPETNWTLYLDNMVEEAKLAERLGFDEYWVGEHHSAGHETVPNPLMMLARIAEATDSIRLGPATVNLTYNIHDPFHVAEQLAFLDQLSHGRAMYGYGAGALPRDMAMFDVDFERQKDIMWEAIDVIETYLTADEPTDFNGEFFQYEDLLVQLPSLQESPQSAVAGLSSRGSFTGAIKGGHRPLCLGFSPLEAPENPEALSLRDMRTAIVEAAEEIGRDPDDALRDWGIGREVYVAESKEQAIDDVYRGVEEYYEYLFDLGEGDLVHLAKTHADQTEDDLTVEWMIENFPFIIGSPEDCVKQIKALQREVGPFGYLIINSHDWYLPERKWRASLELFAEEVMPAFQSRKGPRDIEKRQVPGYEPVDPSPTENPFKIESSEPAPADDD